MPDDEALTCVECGREQRTGERCWKAYLMVEEDEPAEAVVYCMLRVRIRSRDAQRRRR